MFSMVPCSRMTGSGCAADGWQDQSLAPAGAVSGCRVALVSAARPEKLTGNGAGSAATGIAVPSPASSNKATSIEIRRTANHSPTRRHTDHIVLPRLGSTGQGSAVD
jgi:hypothetical protein